MTQPTVGRVVWFWPSPNEQLAFPREGQPLAAHVAAVSEDGGTVNLQVIDANGHAHARQDVPFVQPNYLPPAFGGSYAEWMSYQRAQHAKRDAEHPDPAPLGCSDSPSPNVKTPNVEAQPVESEPPLFYTTQAGPDTNYETVTTPSDGAKPEFANTSAN